MSLRLRAARALARWRSRPDDAPDPAVSYTHLDVYKRQVLVLSRRVTARGQASI